MRRTVYIAVGANIDPERHVAAALERLQARLEVTAVSTFYQTAPLDRPEQEPYVNGVLQARTGLSPRVLKFDVLRRIEADLGRRRTGDPSASREIDLDLVLYGEDVIREPDLRVPDPDLRQRSFVAVPVLELDPELVLPDSGERLGDLEVARDSDGLQPLPELTAALRRQISTFSL